MRRGMTLIQVLSLMAMLSAFSFMAFQMWQTAYGRLTAHKQAQEAAAMALSGRDYARWMVRSRRWSGPIHFQSPIMPTGGSFQVDLQPRDGGYEVVSEGQA